MATKTELAEVAREQRAKGKAFNEETGEITDLVTASRLRGQTDGVMSVALMSDDDFDTRLGLLKKGLERVSRVQREYMVPDVDYGLIPGTPKPTLFKPGAEKLAQLYGLTARIESQFISGDNTMTPPLTYDSQCFLHVGNFDGPIVGIGHGTANSWEKRYRREAAKVCPNCGKASIIKSKAEYGGGWYCFPKKDGCGSKFPEGDERMTGQSSTDAAGDAAGQWDLGVTLMKMAEKRAFVDAVLRATATSGLFTQDVAEEVVTQSAVAQRPAPEPEVRVQRDAPPARLPQQELSVEAAEAMFGAPGTGTVEDAAEMVDRRGEGLTEEEFGAVVTNLGATEVIDIGPSDTETERGGRTANANTAQIEELRRLARELHWGAKRMLTHANEILDTDMAIPEDAREAKAELEAWLEADMSAATIGKIISEMRSRLDADLPA